MSSESKHEVQGAASPAARQVQQDLDEVAREGEDAKRPSSIAKGVKRCAKCGEVKALVGFSNRRKAKDGLQPYCRQCDKAKSAQRRVEHREVIRARKKALRASYAARTDAELLATRPEFKKCSDCWQTRPAESFTVNRGNPDGLHTQCRECQYKRASKYSRTPRGRATKTRHWRRTPRHQVARNASLVPC